MENILLVTGNKKYSASSLRPWLLLCENDIPFIENSIDLFKPDAAEKLGPFSPSLKVPVLIHDDITVWDSMSICEYINETFLENRAWPGNIKKKAAAKSICSELHSDFENFRKKWPLNFESQLRGPINATLEKEIARLDAIMYCCRRKYGDGGQYLFGDFSIVDCFMAPYAISLRQHGAEISWKSNIYVETLIENPHVQWWMELAREEIEQLPYRNVG